MDAERSPEEVGRPRAEIDHERRRESRAAVLREEHRAVPRGRQQRNERPKVAGGLSRQGMATDRLAVDGQEVLEPLGRAIFDDRHPVSLRDSDVVASLGFHLGEDGVGPWTQIDADRVARLHEPVRPEKPSNTGADVLPSRLDTKVADDQRLGGAPSFESADQLLEDLIRARLVLGQDRAFRDVVEAALATHDGAPVPEHDTEGLPSGRAAKVGPPGGLHESRRAGRFEEGVPDRPPMRRSDRRRKRVTRLNGERRPDARAGVASAC